MQLSNIQQNFKSLMLDHPDAVHNLDDDFASVFNEGEIKLSDRLKVYRNNIVGSLTDNLIAAFPVIEKLVGKEFLEGMARTYALQNPPTQGCLNQYGNDLDTFIRGFEPAKSLPYLPDIATFEIAMNQAYYAENDTALQPEDLAKIPPEELSDTKIKLRHSVNFVQSKYPILAIREFCLSETNQEELDLNQGGDRLMIFRPNLNVDIIKLDDDEYLMLKNLKQESSLGEAVQKTLERHESFDIQNLLQKHLQLETFRALATNI